MSAHPGSPGSSAPVAVLGYAVHVPGASAWETGGGATEGEVMCSAEETHLVLGRKGLLMKEPSTKLALCAVQRAFGLPPGKLDGPLPLADCTAVVVSSNLGNLHTVCRLAAAVRGEGFRAVSPLEAPNASSNVIASTIAIRYAFTGPNVMLCNGATSGLDAVRLGARLIRAGRAARVVVVGVEPDDEISQALAKSRDPQTYGARGAPALRASAACVILGSPDGDWREAASGVMRDAAGAPVIGAGGSLPPGADRSVVLPERHRGLVHVPHGMFPDHTPAETVDLTDRLGETYGALGVLQTAAAAARIASGEVDEAYVACGDMVEGYTWLALSAGAADVIS